MYLHGSDLMCLKQRGLALFPITSMGSFSPNAFEAARPVSRTLLDFPTKYKIVYVKRRPSIAFFLPKRIIQFN